MFVSHRAPKLTFMEILPGRSRGCDHLLGKRRRQWGSEHEASEKAGSGPRRATMVQIHSLVGQVPSPHLITISVTSLFNEGTSSWNIPHGDSLTSNFPTGLDTERSHPATFLWSERKPHLTAPSKSASSEGLRRHQYERAGHFLLMSSSHSRATGFWGPCHDSVQLLPLPSFTSPLSFRNVNP